MTDKLIEELKRASEGSRELSDKVLLARGWRRIDPGSRIDFPFWLTPEPESHDTDENSRPCPTTNLQDALDYVVPEGWMYEVHRVPTDEGVNYSALVNWQPAGRSHANNAALALCIAALKAREAGG